FATDEGHLELGDGERGDDAVDRDDHRPGLAECAALHSIDSFVHLALLERHAVARHLLLVEEVTADETPGAVRENDAAAVPEVVPCPPVSVARSKSGFA